jgi:hypothetical protein
MSVSSWRAVLLALCLAAAVLNAITLVTDSIQSSSAKRQELTPHEIADKARAEVLGERAELSTSDPRFGW